MRERPLVVVSNRLPFRAIRRETGLEFQRSPGGLVSALEPVLRKRGGVWVGWPGIAREDVPEGTRMVPVLEASGCLAGVAATPPATPPATSAVHQPLATTTDGEVRYLDVALSSHEVAAYYGGFSNRTIWPLFHYFVDRMVADAGWWRAYERVNQRFAQAAAQANGEDALVWIHDYQLLRVAHHLRPLAPHVAIALFLHIPFPAADVFRALPWSRELLRGMLAADYVGFHVSSYVNHFCRCAEQLLGCEVDRRSGTIYYEGRTVGVGTHPISIDVTEAEGLLRGESSTAAGAARIGTARPPRSERPIEILGVDRLDYTKGIIGRLLAIERLLERRPSLRRRLQFTQILVPSRERVQDYGQLKRDIDETVGRINGRFSEPGWSPIRYLVRSLPPEELFATYRRADVALVTPLRDGMNLVAKEYVVSQLDDEGVLILSEMAGAAEELQEALLVNPYDVDAVADALYRAMTMAEDERRARMSALRARVRGHDVHQWVSHFLQNADRAAIRAHAARASPVDEVRRRLTPWLADRPTVALLLDYDGTLTPIARRPRDARLSPLARATLEAAARTPNLDVAIISGRSLADIEKLVGIPGLTYAGNHGFEIEGPGISMRHPETARFVHALQQATSDLIALGIEGAYVESKGASVAFHYRTVKPDRQMEARRLAEGIFRKRRLRAILGKKVVEGRPPVDWHKGLASLWMLTQRHGADWPSRVRALYVGDDTTDEDAFRTLRGIGRSICVVPAGQPTETLADYRLPNPDAVIQFLRWLASGAFAAAAG